MHGIGFAPKSSTVQDEGGKKQIRLQTLGSILDMPS